MKNLKNEMSYNLRLIKVRRSYNLSEMAALFGKDRKTCQRWVKDEGLQPIEKGTNPLLVMGADLKEFLKERAKKRKTNLDETEFYCFKCRRPVKAKMGSGKIIKTGKMIGKNNLAQLNKTGVCEACNTKLNKFLGVYQQD